MQNGYMVTEVKDRNYFKSIYFREPGGVLFEIATDEPGFEIDEDEAHLGELIKLPEWAEPSREKIEKNLTPVKLDIEAYVWDQEKRPSADWGKESTDHDSW